jgi:hypothetical protein
VPAPLCSHPALTAYVQEDPDGSTCDGVQPPLVPAGALAAVVQGASMMGAALNAPSEHVTVSELPLAST